MFAVCLWELATNQQMTLLMSHICVTLEREGDEKIASGKRY